MTAADYAVRISRPGHPDGDVQLGPWPYPHQAQHAAIILDHARQHTAMLPGTTFIAGPFNPELPALPPLPTDAGSLAELIAGENLDGDPAERFPDLWTRLDAQETYEDARTYWYCALAVLVEREAFAAVDA